ncbi:4-galactosyl-N-acetylglucosaminide 3-alpha-L-fucosyltransferase 9-like [Leptopilina boulardi]|uniref:4-galactosyl-N-acetylglucosaminide 3-alpha-L-fucosyltransferase 9-like n=1 Tax=Leptopilina boulardi TaxID=63433 RepID=UPI0021F51E53|nr:4-galactosyl-N-acetylglucosaminide 3-alpha-L-fucosyltransferase 9-like [Leptopilina boulardi]
MRLSYVKLFKILCAICIVTYIFLKFNLIKQNTNQTSSLDFNYEPKVSTSFEMKKNFTTDEINKMSELGKWLISPEGSPPPNKNTKTKLHLILIWKHGPFLENRHIKRFSSKRFSPWENCSVQCRLSYNSTDIEQADAVIFHLHRIKNVNELPVIRKNYNQRWIFLTDESPLNTFIYKSQKLSNYNNLFNWTMTYRMDSDIPVPYGRTIKLSTILTNETFIYKKLLKKKKLLAILASNCGGKNNRWNYIRELKKILANNFDIFGHCLNGNKTVCFSNFKNDCPILKNYKFYLSFENSNCRQYLTEKVFWNGYQKFAIPIIMGASINDCQQLLPPNSFLHVNNFSSPLSLVNYLLYLNENEKYIQYHMWRKQYRVINEHGYFGSSSIHYCRACEALNYNSMEKKIYNNIENFWNKSKDCNL